MVEGLFMVLVTTNDSNTRLKHAIVSLNSRACSYLPSMKAMGSWVGPRNEANGKISLK